MDEHELREVFSLFDQNGDGLSHKELGRALNSVGVFIRKSDLKQVFKTYDSDGSGTLDFEEFKHLAHQLIEEQAGHAVQQEVSRRPPATQDAGVEKCESGHPMGQRTTSPPGYGGGAAVCNKCQLEVVMASGFFHCPTCQYDVCHRCASKPLAPATQPCPQDGKPMTVFYTSPPEYGGASAQCNLCQKIINASLGFLHCKTCQYDICSACRTVGPAAAAAPAAPVASGGGSAAPAAAPAEMRKGLKKALFIGINYVGSSHALRGCANDVRTIQKLLGFMKIPIAAAKTLTDDPTFQGTTGKPTRKAIEDAIGWFVSGASPGDHLLLHYSGHGTQVADPRSTEADGKEEALCPVDLNEAGVIADDWLLEHLVKPLPSGVRLNVIMDCCHSGSMLDLPVTFSGSREAVSAARRDGIVRAGGSGASAGLRCDAFLISGCADEQTSADVSSVAGFKLNEAVAGRGAGGACTSALAEALSEKTECSMTELLQNMRKSLKERGFTQIPQLSSTKAIDPEGRFELTA